MAPAATDFDLLQCIPRVHTVTRAATWGSRAAGFCQDCGMSACVEKFLIRCVACAAETRDFLRSRDSIRRRPARCLAMFDTRAVACVAT